MRPGGGFALGRMPIRRICGAASARATLCDSSAGSAAGVDKRERKDAACTALRACEEAAVHKLLGTQALIPARWLPSLATLIALTLGLMSWTENADARLGDGFSFAGAGVTDSFDWSTDLDNSPLPQAAQPSYPGGSLVGLFSRGDLIGGFAAGFLGAGVIGILFGHGVVGELSGVASVLGLLFQLALIAMLARLIWTWWHDDKTDALAGLSPRQLADAYGRPRHEALPDIDPGASLDPAHDETTDDGLGHPK